MDSYNQEFVQTNYCQNVSTNTVFNPPKHTHGLCLHNTKPIKSSLVLDEFGIQYEQKMDAEDIIKSLKQHY